MKTYFYLIRHGQTDWNAAGKIQGQVDIPLNETGIKQAKDASLSAAITSINPDVIYASPLSRALDTAKILFPDYKKEILIHEKLIERSYGKYEGYPIALVKSSDTEPSNKEYDGESKFDVYQRINSALKEIGALHEGKRIVIATHGSTIISFLRNAFEECAMAPLNITNCSITLISLENDKYELIYMPKLKD